LVVSAQLSLIGALFAMNCAGLLAGNAFQIASVASIQLKTPVAVVKPVSQPAHYDFTVYRGPDLPQRRQLLAAS
jgi:hypothetical protein